MKTSLFPFSRSGRIVTGFFIWSLSFLSHAHELKPEQAGTRDIPRQNWEQLAGKIPDITVLDQDGNKQRFYTDLIKGKTVAINFVFTTCTSVCPVLTEVFRGARAILDGNGNGQVRLISISVDPSGDTPQKLKEFSSRFHADSSWTFVTADKAGTDRLLKSLGAFSARRDDHPAMMLIGSDTGDRWTRSYGMIPATALVQIIDEARLTR